MQSTFAAEGGYQIFTLGGAEWFWLIFSIAVSAVALVAGWFMMQGVLSRDTGTDEVTVLRAGQVSLDVRTRRAAVGDRNVELTAREFALLETLMRHAGQVMSREQLLSHVWGYDFDPGSNVVDVYVRYLRRKLGAGVIETVRGMGYRLPA